MSWILAATVGALFGVGAYHLLQRDAVKLVLGYSLLLGATNLFLLSCATFSGTEAPYSHVAAHAVDPVPQALVLTAIVIGFAVTAFLTALVLLIAWRLRTLDVDEISRLRG